ncbi:MAG: SDR family oxidoreductase [Hyphomonadaceae bacterium]|nr:SDR family oxidoreductase [Hyphomonadaceae bacterium]
MTGAASGIGRATVLEFVRDARMRQEKAPGLLLVDMNQGGLEETARLVGEQAGMLTVTADLADVEQPKRLVELAVDRFGGLDVIVSNAGVLIPGSLRDLTVLDYERTFAVNTRATWLLGQAALPHMEGKGGAIVATASIGAVMPPPMIGAYGPSKAALTGLIRLMAQEWGPLGIRSNSVSPGPTLTGMTQNQYGHPEGRQRREAAIPVRRLGVPEDIANAIVFLSRPESGFINGIDITVDGGMMTTLLQASVSQAK